MQPKIHVLDLGIDGDEHPCVRSGNDGGVIPRAEKHTWGAANRAVKTRQNAFEQGRFAQLADGKWHTSTVLCTPHIRVSPVDKGSQHPQEGSRGTSLPSVVVPVGR
ncbi:hypothetical protein GCM10009784_18440 [Arthrobacter parietis]|uniref:Uncharacterized protein n=1 Tax=Arthrobacter parietis TaxID=271434 RepID=A0ABN3AVV9_9MICC